MGRDPEFAGRLAAATILAFSALAALVVGAVRAVKGEPTTIEGLVFAAFVIGTALAVRSAFS